MNASDDVGKGLDVVMLLAIAAGGYLIYKVLQSLNPNNPNNPVGAATNAISSGIASAYEALTFGPPVNATGTLASQSGQVLGPISSFPATTQNGNTYLNVNGTTYQLGPRNSAGNFTAIPVASPTGSTGGTYPQGGTYPPGATVPAGFTGGT